MFPLGYLLLPVIIYLFIFKPHKYLLFLAVFFIPFTATSLFNISLSFIEVKGLRASFIIIFFWLVKVALNYAFRTKINYNRGSTAYLLILSVIAILVLFSQFVPIIDGGETKILDAYTNTLMYATEIDLTYKFQYLSQTLYFLLGLVFVVFLLIEVKDTEFLNKIIKVYLISTLVVCILGIIEFISFKTGLWYPREIFNQNSPNTSHPMLLNGNIRIMSVGLEPSVFSQQLLTTLPFMFWSVYYKNYIFSSKVDKTFTLLILINLLLSISGTAFGGLAFFLILVSLQIFFNFRIKSNWIIPQLLIIVGGLVILPFLISFLGEKLNSYSGVERFKSLEYAWLYFKDFPIFGIGWGVFPSWDLFMCILNGIGILGLILFISLFSKITFGYFNSQNENKARIYGLRDGFFLLLISSQISGFIYHSQYFWLVIGISILGIILVKNKLSGSQV